MELFTINNINARDDKLGELILPHLYAISSGQRNRASLNFHLKIGDFFCYVTINKVNKKSVTMICFDKKCKATHKFSLHENLVKIEKNAIKNKDKFRDKFFIDFADMALRNLENWTVLEHNSKPHTCETQNFYDHLHSDFREHHTSLALLTGRSELETTARSMSVKVKYGPEIESLIFRDKKLEQNSCSRKLVRLIKNDLINGVPASARTVGESNLNDQINFKNELLHHQHTTELQIIFYLEKELIFLETHQNLFADGTFHICKNLDFHQIYVISVLYEVDNKTFSYPIIFSFMKNRLSSTYDELFKFLKDKFYEKFGRELFPNTFRLDCEAAVLKSLKNTA